MKTVLGLLLACGLSAAFPYPYAFEADEVRPSSLQGPRKILLPISQLSSNRRADDDLSFAADTAYAAAAAPTGRVKIQVYRGASKGTGYDVFVPWGYYNTQPNDLSIYH